MPTALRMIILSIGLVFCPSILYGQNSRLFTYDRAAVNSAMEMITDSTASGGPSIFAYEGIRDYSSNPNLGFCLIGGPVGFYFSFLSSAMLIISAGSGEGLALIAGGLVGLMLPVSVIQLLEKDLEKSAFTALGSATGFLVTVILIHSFGNRLRY